jgi:hypothetical protein
MTLGVWMPRFTPWHVPKPAAARRSDAGGQLGHEDESTTMKHYIVKPACSQPRSWRSRSYTLAPTYVS